MLLLKAMGQIKNTNFLQIGIAILLMLIPLIQIQSLSDPTLLSRQFLFVGLGVSVILIVWFLKLEIGFPKSNFLIVALFTWLASSLLSLSYAHNFQEALYSFSKTSLYVAGIALYVGLFYSGLIQLRTISIGLMVCSGIALFYLGLEVSEKTSSGLNLWSQKNLYELHSVFGHKNLYSSFQLLCIPFLIYGMLNFKLIGKIVAGIILLAVLVSLLLIQTKAVLLGIILAITICIPIAGKYLFPKTRKWLIGISIVYGFVLILGVIVVNKFPDKLTLLSNNDTIRERILLWTNTFEMIKKHPILGVGAGNWQVFFPFYGLGDFMQTNYLVSDGYTTFQRPHNDFLWVLSELGLLGFLAYLGIFIYAIWSAIQVLKSESNIKQKHIVLLFLSCLLSYIFVGFVDFPLERNEHQLVLAILLGFLIGSNQKATIKEGIFRKWQLLILMIVFLFSGAIALLRLPNEQNAKKIAMAHASGNWNGILKAYKKINPTFYTLDNFSIPSVWYAGVAQFSLGNTPQAKQYFEQAYAINPFQIHVLNNLASINELEGNHQKSLVYYNELLRISPSQPDAILNKSAVLFNMGKKMEAMECLYQFKYDESNTQFLQYLKLIGKNYLIEMQESGKDIPMESVYDFDFIKDFFRENQLKMHKFGDLEFIRNEEY